MLIGTIDKNSLIQQLIKRNKLNVESITGQWETALIATISKPFEGVDSALVIAGSDRRGTAFGGVRSFRKNGRLALVLVGRRSPEEERVDFHLKRQLPARPPSVKYHRLIVADNGVGNLFM